MCQLLVLRPLDFLRDGTPYTYTVLFVAAKFSVLSCFLPPVSCLLPPASCFWSSLFHCVHLTSGESNYPD